MKPLSRRDFVRTAAVAATAARFVPALQSQTPAAAAPATPAPRPLPEDRVELSWLEQPIAEPVGTTLGVPWPRGRHAAGTSFAVRTAAGASVPVQSWPLATWPDGSLKWTGHAVVASAPAAGPLAVFPGAAPVSPAKPLTVSETGETVEIDTGVIRCRLNRRGTWLVDTIERGGKLIARHGRLVCLRQSQPDPEPGTPAVREEFVSDVASVTIEQRGPVRAVVKFEGRHASVAVAGGRAWLPFVVRLYFHAGTEAVRVVHTFVFDGDESQDFIAGLGLRFDVPLRDPLYDRHIRFVGDEHGLWAEAVQGLTGLRRDPGAAVRAAQLAGQACPPLAEWDARVASRLQYVPTWSDFTLTQTSADGFAIRKRTRRGFSWIDAGAGRRAGGTAYVGGASGGLVFGLTNFWQSHPAQLDIRGAATEQAEATLWLWSPEAPPMDLRFYHDGMGQDTFEKQLEGLNITYEDYEPGFGTPHGVARTSEAMLWATEATPTRERLVALADTVRTPPRLVCRPEYYQSIGLFGGLWAVPDRSNAARAQIEDQLDFCFDYYRRQTEQHHWYGFWNYGDVRHTYDADRHVWRYDVGGFAWDNSELSPDLWLWYSFLRTGRADIFRYAEAMTRHTGEVDVYHLGRFRGLGSRHNVLHWGCSAKQVRISTAVYRRCYYYLTADERVGDLMRELLDCDERLVDVSPGRKVGRSRGDTRYPADISFGTDWCSFAAAWLTEWERTGDVRWRDKLLTGMKGIGTMPQGWFSSGGGYDPKTGMIYPHDDKPSASHLNAVFGAVEISAELLQLLSAPEYDKAWLQYCTVYNAEPEEQRRRMGRTFENRTLRQGHSRLTAYAAARLQDPELARRAWREFRAHGGLPTTGLKATRLSGPAVLNPVDEAAAISTNSTAQFGLAAIQCLALAGGALE
jgi:hypothetical protein